MRVGSDHHSSNVSVESEIIEMFNQVDQQLGTLTAFVNNAESSSLETPY